MPLPKVGTRYLSHLLPSGWEKFFTGRRFGSHWGLEITCPICSEKPPKELKYSARKWRWLSSHVASHV
jgi:hypothetical protein